MSCRDWMFICLGQQEGLLAAWEVCLSGDAGQLSWCLSPFTDTHWEYFRQEHGMCDATARGGGGAVWRMLSLFQVVLMFPFSLLPPVAFPPSLWQALQEQAWTELPLCSYSSCQWRGWWSPGAGDPLFSCPQKWKPQTWVVFSLYLWDPFWRCCLQLFFALWRLAWLPGSVVSDWYLDAWS